MMTQTVKHNSHFLADEHPLAVRRQHRVVMVPAVISFVIVLIGGEVAISFVPATFDKVSLISFLGLARLAVALFAVYIPCKRWLLWKCSVYTLTDHRILVRHGILSRKTESIALDRVQETVVRVRLPLSLFGIGDLIIESAGREGVEALIYIGEPEDFNNQLMQAIENYRRGGGLAMPNNGPPQMNQPGPSGGGVSGGGVESGGMGGMGGQAPTGGSNVQLRGRPMPWQDDDGV